MEPGPQPDWNKVRHIVQDWMRGQQISIRELSRRTGLSPSVLSRFFKGETTLETGSTLKLYAVLQGGINTQTMHTFLEETGLLELAQLLSREPALAPTNRQTRPPHANTAQIHATSLMDYAYRLCPHRPTDAIQMFQAAEQAFGPTSSQAGLAGLKVAEQLMNIGNYDRAYRELQRVQQTYVFVLDPATRSILYDRWGWYHYYTGNLEQAEHWFLKNIDFAEETGYHRLASECATHFLGRVYFEMGKRCRQRAQAQALFEKAKAQFDVSCQIRSRLGMDGEAAWDLFRKSQVLQQQGAWHEARRFRESARANFAGLLVHLYVRMAEAEIALEQGQPRAPLLAAGDALTGWSQVRYAKGIADSLRFMGEWEISNGKPDRALEHYTAAACIFPYGGPQGIQELRSEIVGLRAVITHQGGRNGSREIVWRIREQARERRGSFSWLNQIDIDRSSDVERVFAWISQVSSR